MGHKGVSKRKSKKVSPSSNASISNANTRAGNNSPVSALVRDNSAPLNRGGVNPSAGSNKTQKKR